MVFLTPAQLTEMLKSYEQSYAQFERTVANAQTLKDKVGELEYALQKSVARVTELEAELDRAKPLPGGELADFTSDDDDDDDEPDIQRNPLSRGKRARIDDDDDDEPDVQPPLPSATRARIDDSSDDDDDDSSDEDSDDGAEPDIQRNPLSRGKRARIDDDDDEDADDSSDEAAVQPKPLPRENRFNVSFSSDEDADEDESVNMWKENEPPASNPKFDWCEACDYFAGEDTCTGVLCKECGHDGTTK
jgi:hypothetical protein